MTPRIRFFVLLWRATLRRGRRRPSRSPFLRPSSFIPHNSSLILCPSPLLRLPALLAAAFLLSFLGGCRKPHDPGTAQGTNTHARAKFPGLFDSKVRAQQKIMLPDGTLYEGEIDDDGKPDGLGRLRLQNGTDQSGEWHHGEAYRLTGTWVAPDGTKEVGVWNRDGTKCGGTINWPDGRKYEGDWRIIEGTPERPHGTGVMTWPDGHTYTGQFRDGEMDGPGKMTWPDGRVQSGSWLHGVFHDSSL